MEVRFMDVGISTSTILIHGIGYSANLARHANSSARACFSSLPFAFAFDLGIFA
jgi:hypothetical protein